MSLFKKIVVIPESYTGSLGKDTELIVFYNLTKCKPAFENESWHYEINK